MRSISFSSPEIKTAMASIKVPNGNCCPYKTLNAYTFWHCTVRSTWSYFGKMLCYSSILLGRAVFIFFCSKNQQNASAYVEHIMYDILPKSEIERVPTFVPLPPPRYFLYSQFHNCFNVTLRKNGSAKP